MNQYNKPGSSLVVQLWLTWTCNKILNTAINLDYYFFYCIIPRVCVCVQLVSDKKERKYETVFCPIRLNSGLKFLLSTSIFAQLLSSAFHVISCDKKWWSKLGEATESLQKLTWNLTSASIRGASGRGSVLGSRWGRAESPASPGTEGPCPRCVSAQGGSVSVATVASENGFRKQQADCQLSADRKRAG